MKKDERWGILGKNGIGKTSLLQTLAGLRTPVEGKITIDGQGIHEWSRRELAIRNGILFQDSHDSFPVTVFNSALCGRHPHLPFWAIEGQQDHDIVMSALALLGLNDLAHRQVNTLSGGERRRLAVATLMVQNPKIWFLDEPTNHLDISYQIAVLDLLCQKYRENDGAIIMVLHDVNLVVRYCTHAGLMINAEEFITGPVTEVINENNLQSLYGHPVRKISEYDRVYFVPE